MDRQRKLTELVKGLQRKGQVFFSATVDSVQGLTCTVKVDDLSIPNVRLNPTTNNDDEKVLLTPKVGSNVLVGSFTGDLSNLIVLKADAVSEAYLKVDATTFKLDKNGVKINDGENGGVVNVSDMVGWMNKVYNDLQTLKIQLAEHLVAGNGVALGLVFSVTTPEPIEANFEDNKLTH